MSTTNDFMLRAFNSLSSQDFEEVPVEIEEFVSSPDFMGLKKMSEHQYSLVKAMSQVYKYETLVALYGEEKAAKRWKETKKEVTMQLGKGSGKDFTSTIAVAYVVYLLLCLKDPSVYYDQSPGDSIDIINVAINADQANRVFFKNFKNRIEKCPWFEGKYIDKNGVIEFDKNVSVYSGHSEREAFEGYNTLIVILDEISGFALTSDSGHAQAKTAPAIYEMYRHSVTSRYPEFGKLVLLSFPRFKDDFIQQKYNESVAEKEVVMRKHTFKLDPELPDGYPGNEFEIEWEEDHILRYTTKGKFALRRPSWEVNPNRKIEDYTDDFYQNPGLALGKFACMPSNLEEGYFKNAAAIETAFSGPNGVDQDGIFHPKFLPKPDTKYFVHVDLAQKHDRCAVALAHVDSWVDVSIGAIGYTEMHPVVVVDALRWWQPTKDKSVDFEDVRNYILALRRRGFDLGRVTFDRWNSHDTMKILAAQNIETDTLSVAKKHYDDFLTVMYEGRLFGPNEELLIEELGQLRLVKDKIDHPRKGYKDLSDAVCGAIFNAVSLTDKPQDLTVEVMNLDDIKRRQRSIAQQQWDDNVIRAPKGTAMPDDIADYMSRLKVL